MVHLLLNGEDYHFNYYEDEKIWVGKILCLNKEFYCEIQYTENIIELEEVLEYFYNFIENKINSISIQKLQKLLVCFKSAQAEPKDIEKYEFRFEGIRYCKDFEYYLIFKTYHSDYLECYEPYNSYFVKMNGLKLIGIEFSE